MEHCGECKRVLKSLDEKESGRCIKCFIIEGIGKEPACHNKECSNNKFKVPEKHNTFEIDELLSFGKYQKRIINRHLYEYRNGEAYMFCDKCHNAIQSFLAINKSPRG